tara:strand:- start:81 stop:512 length:432 start_codon:yes stop_codon:yes gene_type:complete
MFKGKIEKFEAILSLVPNSQFVLHNDGNDIKEIKAKPATYYKKGNKVPNNKVIGDIKTEEVLFSEAVKGIEWRSSDKTEPTESEIDAEIIRLQGEYDALEWKRLREKNYPSIAELTVALYDTEDKSAIEVKRTAVKEKYPKPK